MPPKIGKYNKKITGELRRSQLLTTYGSGALADFPRFSGIMAGLDDWPVQTLPETAKIREKNLEVMLGKQYFYQVFSSDEELKHRFTLPVYRFPSWYYCPECHRLDRYSKIAKTTSGNTSEYNSALVCNRCSNAVKSVKLIPSRFVVACLNGHIDDFPYIWWCHRQKGVCDNPKLQLQYKGNTGGLDSIHVICETCGADTTMAGCMDKDAFRSLKCNGTMPWLGIENKQWYKDPCNCGAKIRCLQRSANNVYYSKNKSALTIPPLSTKINKIIQNQNSVFDFIFDRDNDDVIKALLKDHYSKNSQTIGVDYNTFETAVFAYYRDIPEDVNERSLRKDEYSAFTGPDVDDEDFKTESEAVPDIMSKYFKQIKLIKKLREVMVIQGFRRILPVVDPDDPDAEGLNNNEFSPLSKEPKEWLPAIELYGEGIFLELNEDLLEQWENKNRDHYKKMFERHGDKSVNWIGHEMFDFISPRYVLLHTLAHLLIRQLTAQCGYATASIKEKIYSTLVNDDKKMCGILIYTSATDTDGSLGGLVREGQTDRMKTTFENMLQENSWCSNDPLCIESLNQGYKGLNYSACHACTLLPETSCEAFNCLLDRAAVVGLPVNKELSFFEELM